MPRVSVVIPAFNAASTIAGAIASVAAQTCGDWEIVVVDDGSTDATGEIVAGLSAREPRIRQIRQQNLGLADARNRGIAESAGAFLLFLDADDTITPLHFENLVQAIGADGDAVAYSGYSRVDEHLQVFATVFDPSMEAAPFEAFAWRNRLAVHCVLLPRALFAGIGEFDPTLDTCEDWDLWLRLARSGVRFVGSAEPTALYHTSAGSMSRDFVRLSGGAAEVLARARKPDPRVASPALAHAEGFGGAVAGPLAYFTLWAATAAAAADGAIPQALLDVGSVDLAGQAGALAETIRDAISIGARIPEDQVGRKWREVQPVMASTLSAIEAMSSEAGLARRIVYDLERTVLRQDPLLSPLHLSLIHGERVAMHALPSWNAPGDLLHLRVQSGTDEVFRVEIPCYGAVNAAEVARLVETEMGDTRLASMRPVPIRWSRLLGHVLRNRRFPSRRELTRLNWAPLDGQDSESETARRRIAAAVEADLAGMRPVAEAPQRPAGGHAGQRSSRPDDATTRSLPILMYHMVADDGPEGLARYRIDVAGFTEQVAFLRSEGFHTVTSDMLDRHRQSGEPFPGRPVMLTFDDGYRDFYENAWPVLHGHGFLADVFVVTGKVGGKSDWDRRFGAPQQLMTWGEIAELSGKGVAFGSHLVTHRHVDALSTPDLFEEALRSRRTLEDKLGTGVRAIASPSGGLDERSIRVFDAAGYHLCYSTRGGIATIDQHALDLPRIEITGDMSLGAFAHALGPA